MSVSRFDWRRVFIYTHRWLGIAGCILFVVWFVSGVVMMYVGYPKLTPLERLQHLPDLSLDAACCISPQQALLALYTIGALASRVLGQQLIVMLEGLIVRVPGVHMIYSAAKKLVDVLRHKPGNIQRVVLIDFPSAGLKAIGFVMHTFPDAKTGEKLAAVYVPTAPNPTSGDLQIVPYARLVQTDIQGDQAMSMILSGGAVTPDHISIQA